MKHFLSIQGNDDTQLEDNPFGMNLGFGEAKSILSLGRVCDATSFNSEKCLAMHQALEGMEQMSHGSSADFSEVPMPRCRPGLG